MDSGRLTQKTPTEWWIEPHGAMRVPGILFASEALIRGMDDKVFEQVSNVATLPGIVRASYAMPDAHWGYGFPIGGVAAFDPDTGGVISVGGVGFDISCGVRLLRTGMRRSDLRGNERELAEELARVIPVGVGRGGHVRLEDAEQLDAMLEGGAAWAVARGYGTKADLDAIEEHGTMHGAEPGMVSELARRRQRDQMGTLGSGNHYLEVQSVSELFDASAAGRFALEEGDLVVSIHSGSRGLGHQIGSEFLRRMTIEAPRHGLQLPDRELACVPITSRSGQAYLGAMRAAVNCALANRQVLTAIVREVFGRVAPGARLTLLYDVSHNTCNVEKHRIDGHVKSLFVHRKGATRAFGAGHPDLPAHLRDVGQPVLVGGSMGTGSYVLVGTDEGMTRALGSACHGAGRAMSRHQALRQFTGRQIVADLAARGILIRSPSPRGVAEEAPGAYKDVTAVVDAAEQAGLSRKVARLEPVICIKG